MSLRLDEEKTRQAQTRVDNMFMAAVALIRERKARVLNLLTPDKMAKREYRQPAMLLVRYYAAIERKMKGCKNTTMFILSLHPEFDPEKMYGKVIIQNGDTTIFTVPIENCPTELRFVRYQWNIEMLRFQQLQEYIEELNVYADAMWDMTAQAIIQKMEDFTRRPWSYGVDSSTAEDITTAFEKADTKEAKEGKQDE